MSTTSHILIDPEVSRLNSSEKFKDYLRSGKISEKGDGLLKRMIILWYE